MELHYLRAAEKETVLRLPEEGRFSAKAKLFAHQQMIKDGFQCGGREYKCNLLQENEIDTPDAPACGRCVVCQKASSGYDFDDIIYLLIGAGRNTSLSPGTRFLAYLYWYKMEEICYPWGNPDALPLDLCALACADVRNSIWTEQMQWEAIDRLLGAKQESSVHYLHDKGQEVLLRLPEKGRFSQEAVLFAHQQMIAQGFQCGGTWYGQEHTCNLLQQNEIEPPETPLCGGFDEKTWTGCKICRNVPMYVAGIPLLLVGVCQNKSLSVLVRFLAALYWYMVEETCFPWDKVNAWPLDLCALVCMDYDHGDGAFGNFLVQTLQWDAMKRLFE